MRFVLVNRLFAWFKRTSSKLNDSSNWISVLMSITATAKDLTSDHIFFWVVKLAHFPLVQANKPRLYNINHQRVSWWFDLRQVDMETHAVTYLDWERHSSNLNTLQDGEKTTFDKPIWQCYYWNSLNRLDLTVIYSLYLGWKTVDWLWG